MIATSCNVRMRIPVLDLHGVKHEDADRLVHEFVNRHWGPDKELHIITGHSILMKTIVDKALNFYDVERTHGDPRNTGYIRILT